MTLLISVRLPRVGGVAAGKGRPQGDVGEGMGGQENDGPLGKPVPHLFPPLPHFMNNPGAVEETPLSISIVDNTLEEEGSFSIDSFSFSDFLKSNFCLFPTLPRVLDSLMTVKVSPATTA